MDGARSAYSPPSPKRLPALMEEICVFLNAFHESQSIPSILGLIQILLVHPFDDANGRLARAIFVGRLSRQAEDPKLVVLFIQFLWAHQGLELHRLSHAVRSACAEPESITNSLVEVPGRFMAWLNAKRA